MKRLIVTADDVGLHPAMTAGALRAHDQGIVTAVSVTAVGGDAAAGLAGAAAALRARPTLDCGVHLVLVGERPLSPPAEVRSLVRSGGGLLPGFRAFVWRYLRGGIALADVEREWRRQIEAVLAAGMRPVHLNSHQHLHALPRLFALAGLLAVEYRLAWLRVPTGSAASGAGRRGVEVWALDRLGRAARRQLEGGGTDGPRAVGRTAGILHAGHLTVPRLLGIVERLEGTTELVCHPGSDDAALGRAYDWGYEWEAETAALCDARVREALDQNGVELAGFAAS